MFFVLSKLLDIAFSPLAWAMACFALAIPWRTQRRLRHWKRRRAFGIVGLVILYFFSVEPVSNAMFYRLEHSTTSTYRPDVTYDAVVLLGGVSDERVVYEMSQPAYNENVERLVATHRVLADGHAKVAIISGAAMHPDLIAAGEARVLAKQIVDWGVDESRVIIEEQARNTYENALFSKKIAEERGFKNVLIITSAFHMRRSVECFEAVGMNVDSLMVDYRAHSSKSPGSDSFLPRAASLGESTSVLREVFGLWVYRARGYAKPKSR